MKFLYPDFLFALLAVAIPIIIHLFNFRKFKKIYFSNVQFLKEVKQETQSKSQLKHLLVLLSRILAIAFLVLAFAQPYIPVDDQKTVAGQQTVSVYIDNSFSMNSVNGEGRLFDIARQYGYEIAKSYQPSDLFQILTNDFEGRHQRLYNREDFEQMVEEIDISPSSHLLSDVVKRQTEALSQNGSGQKTLYVISDFQRLITDFDQFTNDSTVQIRLIPVPPEQSKNLYIDSCWFENPVKQIDVPQELSIRIRNISGEEYQNVPIKLLVNDQQKALGSFTIAPHSETDTVLTFTATQPGIQKAELRITDYPVTFDDNFFFSYNIAPQLSVLTITAGDDSARYIQNLFAKDDYFKVDIASENQLNYANLNDYHLILLHELGSISSGLGDAISRYIENGGSTFIIPSDKTDIPSYNQLFQKLGTNTFSKLDTAKTAVRSIETAHPIYKNVFESIPENMDLPVVPKHFRFAQQTKTDLERLLILENGDLFMGQYTYGRGKVYLTASPLSNNFSNFARHALFVPTLYNMAIQSQTDVPLFYTIGKDEVISLTNVNIPADNVFHLTLDQSDIDIIPEHKILNFKTSLFVHNQIAKAGNYQLESGDWQTGISFNYQRKESDLRTYSPEEIKELFEQSGLSNVTLIESDYAKLSNSLSQVSRGKQLWEFCILLTLLLLGIEILLIKFLKG